MLLPLAVPHPRPAELVPEMRAHSHSKRRVVADPTVATTLSQSVARGVLVTPWFAAATGFVIAVSMWVLWPHADLHILAGPAINKEPYGPNGTSGVAGSKGGEINTKSSPPRSTASQARGDHGATGSRGAKGVGASVRYYVAQSGHDSFDIVITVPGRHARTHWELAFLLRGDESIRVFGANWQPTGQDGGLASEWPGAQHWRGDQNFGEPGGDRNSHDVSFQVYGSGSNIRPTGCVLNGKACHFTEVRP